MSTKKLTYCALGIALAVVMNQIAPFRMPQGGSVTLISMFFITVLGYWFGLRVGLLAGLSMGLINMVLGGIAITAVGALLDYPIAFGVLGLSGLFKGRKHGLILGFLTGGLMRYFVHVLSGIFIWYMYAPDGQNVILYSLVYNAFLFPELIITLVLLMIPSFRHVIERLGD